MNEARNPVANADTEDTAAEDSDSGEGRLGDRANGSQRSSGGWKGAGAPGAAATGNGLAGGVKLGADSSLMTKGMGMNEEGQPYYGPPRPPQFGDQGSGGWNWSGIDDQDGAADGGAGSDAGSTTANVDQDDDGDAFMADDPPELETTESSSGAAGAGTPNDADDFDMTYSDDHGLYSGGRSGQYGYDGNDNVLYVENVGSMGSNSTVEMRSPLGVGQDSEDSSKDLLE